jgi:hypothetical protein
VLGALDGELRQLAGAQLVSANELLTVCRKILNFNFIVVALLQDYFILSSPAKQWIEQIDNSANVKFQQGLSVVDALTAQSMEAWPNSC